MSKSCKGLAMELVKCLSETDCVKVEKRPYRECAKDNSIPSECIGLRETYFNCKRGQGGGIGFDGGEGMYYSTDKQESRKTKTYSFKRMKYQIFPARRRML